MDFNKNYYGLLSIQNTANSKEIKKAYYKLSFIHHPDKGGDQTQFDAITEAYDVLMDNTQRDQYDTRSKFGNNYDEALEMLNFEFSNVAKAWDKDKLDKFTDDNVLNIIQYVDDSFDGTISYNRYVLCKKCDGSGKDLTSKIQIKDSNGNLVRSFDASDGCDFCDGTGKDWIGNVCSFCMGAGKVGSNDCKECKGEKRILGKQKLSGITFPENEDKYRVDFMGHASKTEGGKVGHLWLLKKKDPNKT